MAVVTLAYPTAAFPRPLTASGYLVPAVDGHPVKAVTYSSVKWPHLCSAEPGLVVVRCSIGRIGEEGLLHRDDADLAALAAADLAEATGVRGGPASYRVTRWGGALPQYTVGHLDRVDADPRRRGEPARPRRLRRRLRRDRDPRMHRHRPGGGAPDPGPPGPPGPAARRPPCQPGRRSWIRARPGQARR